MTAHSPAAIAAFIEYRGARSLGQLPSMEAFLTAYDRGAADTLAVKHEADREALARVIFETGRRQVGKPVVNTTVLAAYMKGLVPDRYRLAAALTAPDGPLRDEREVKAEAWDEGYMAVPAEPEDREFFVEDADNPYRKGVL